MPYQLQNNLWFCFAGGHPVFLDLRTDRYFRLRAAQERAFISFLQGGPFPSSVSLFGPGLVADSSTRPLPEQAHAVAVPRRSALEQASAASGIRFTTVCEVSLAVASVLLRLRTCPLGKVLTRMRRFRERRAVAADTIDKQALEVIGAARIFNSARLYVPVTPCCLLDSLALAVFLARRHIHATVVFGVTCTPFSAHSWVQAGDTVLNDTVGNANSYTPIAVF